MTPVNDVIPGYNARVTQIAKDQPEYLTLPALKVGDECGRVITRWRLSWRERFQVLFGGSIWLTALTFNRRVQPVLLETECPVIDIAEKAFTILDLSPAAYEEIAGKLRAAGYSHVFMQEDGREVIDMAGIAMAAESVTAAESKNVPCPCGCGTLVEKDVISTAPMVWPLNQTRTGVWGQSLASVAESSQRMPCPCGCELLVEKIPWPGPYSDFEKYMLWTRSILHRKDPLQAGDGPQVAR